MVKIKITCNQTSVNNSLHFEQVDVGLSEIKDTQEQPLIELSEH